jgi:hypothetical protein
MEDTLAKQINDWNEQKRSQSGLDGPEYMRLTATFLKVSAMRRRAEKLRIL